MFHHLAQFVGSTHLLKLELEVPIFSPSPTLLSGLTLSSQTGVDILKRGGNAVDAAVATALCLDVEQQSATSIAGGGGLVFDSPSLSSNFLILLQNTSIKWK